MAIQISINQVDNVWVKQHLFENANDQLEGHLHTHNHLTLLAAGRVRVTVNGVDTEFAAPHMIFIRKDSVHGMTALEPGTVTYCIHALREPDTGDIIGDECMPLTSITGRVSWNYEPLVSVPESQILGLSGE